MNNMDLVEWAFNNPNKTVEEIMEEFNVTQQVAWYTVREAGKKLGELDEYK